jgi:hypothetical protein
MASLSDLFTPQFQGFPCTSAGNVSRKRHHLWLLSLDGSLFLFYKKEKILIPVGGIDG